MGKLARATRCIAGPFSETGNRFTGKNVQFSFGPAEFDIPVIHAQLSMWDLALKEGGGLFQLAIHTWQS